MQVALEQVKLHKFIHMGNFFCPQVLHSRIQALRVLTGWLLEAEPMVRGQAARNQSTCGFWDPETNPPWIPKESCD